jgi:AraC family transcriptional regulator of adaptative response/methylated-DNA-[protein]-cysteine methyltransferase
MPAAVSRVEAVNMHVSRLETPIGPMLAATTDQGLCLLEFVDETRGDARLEQMRAALGAVVVPGKSPIAETLARELAAYFAGRGRSFSIPLHLCGTDFQTQVWQGLQAIPYGQTRSYREQAVAIGRPRAVRAVAQANRANRIAIVIPCHRVIGADGHLVGYSAGLWRKQRLLELEQGRPFG